MKRGENKNTLKEAHHIFLPIRFEKKTFELNEESSLTEYLGDGKGNKLVDEVKKKNRHYFEGRNIIKKVKIHCLKIFYVIIKECIDQRAYSIGEYKLKLGDMNMIYQTFKYDISKFRNKILLNLRMKDILAIFSNVNINDDTRVKGDRKFLFYFLMNCTWLEFLVFVKHENMELLSLFEEEVLKDISASNILDYIKYVQKTSNRYKDRANLDNNYLHLYDTVIMECKNQLIKEKINTKLEIDSFMLSFKGY
jgi:hypothetical protein